MNLIDISFYSKNPRISFVLLAFYEIWFSQGSICGLCLKNSFFLIKGVPRINWFIGSVLEINYESVSLSLSLITSTQRKFQSTKWECILENYIAGFVLHYLRLPVKYMC
jgi:hypothetical protein